MSLVQLDIKGISYSQTQSGAYALVLNEVGGERTLPIIIGAFEAQSIAIALEKEIKPPRPLTHDLFRSFAGRFQITVSKIMIYKLVDGVFYSNLTCIKDGIEEIVDARTSDAIALAIRFNAPIFTSEKILDKAGIFLKLDTQETMTDEAEIEQLLNDSPEKEQKNTFHNLSPKELNEKLKNAIENENYELAASIRDEISRRI